MSILFIIAIMGQRRYLQILASSSQRGTRAECKMKRQEKVSGEVGGGRAGEGGDKGARHTRT